jgi:hypothetical protein
MRKKVTGALLKPWIWLKENNFEDKKRSDD